MSPTPGNRPFFSWVRRGVAASINSAPPTGQSRVTSSVQLSIVDQNRAAYAKQPGPVQVQLYSHRDVIGTDPAMIVRTEPAHGTTNFEPNYLCAIEFDGPDFLWMFTPSPPAVNVNSGPGGLPSGDCLPPWVALIVLKQDEFVKLAAPPNPLPVIQVNNIGALQDLTDSWNWAHVQVSGDASLSDSLNSAPGNVISRLICPRRLDPQTAYSAFLVPAYEAARLKGIGQDNSTVDLTTPAWNSKTAPGLQLPLYALRSGPNEPQFQLDFSTSDEGDFESLVRRLKPIENLSGQVGKRAMDVSMPGMDLPAASQGPLGLEGALASTSMNNPWTGSDQAAFKSGLAGLVNQTSPVVDDPSAPRSQDPVIVPPIYGSWPAGVAAVSPGSNQWVAELNLDPRHRAAAGMGTEIIQNERTQLLAAAWQQVDGIIAANQKIQQGQLARAALQQIYTRKLSTATTDSLLTLTASLHSRILASPETMRAKTRASRVPERALSATYRRVTRPRRRLVSPAVQRESLLPKINDHRVIIVPRPQPPQGLLPLDQISEQSEISLRKKLLEILASLEMARRSTHSITRRFFLTIALGLVSIGVGAAIVGTELWEELTELFAGKRVGDQIKLSKLTPKQVNSIPQRPNFVLTAPGTPAPGGTAQGKDSVQAKALRTATAELFAVIQAHPVDLPQKPALSLAAVQKTVLARIEPALTVAQRMRAIISWPGIRWQPSDILASPILAAPAFPQPMYGPLRDVSPSNLLPGADQVPHDSISIVVQNHSFIESYMVGLNHEMTRQLIWEGYPTFDQRGTYFRQFWDVSAYVPQPGDPTDANALQELLKDIPPVPLWNQELGKNLNRQGVPANNVVLLVRGELFRRYPNAIVYAVKAKRTADGTRVHDDSDQRYPIFRGTLPTDMTFLGFNLSIDDAHGGTGTAPDGFFFVFQQPPSEPRFGLEPTRSPGPTTSWADLSWENFESPQATAASTLASAADAVHKLSGSSPWRLASKVLSTVLQNVQLPGFLSSSLAPSNMGTLSDPDDRKNSWGLNSAQTAYILLRMPFRILIHADLMLPRQS